MIVVTRDVESGPKKSYMAMLYALSGKADIFSRNRGGNVV